MVSELKAKHILGESTMVGYYFPTIVGKRNLGNKMLNSIHSKGLNMTEGKVGCMKELGITESFSVKRQVLVQASEAAEMILRCSWKRC